MKLLWLHWFELQRHRCLLTCWLIPLFRLKWPVPAMSLWWTVLAPVPMATTLFPVCSLLVANLHSYGLVLRWKPNCVPTALSLVPLCVKVRLNLLALA